MHGYGGLGSEIEIEVHSLSSFFSSPRVIDVVAECRNEECELVQRPKQRVDLRGLDDREGHVGDAHGVEQVVEGVGVIPLLDPSHEVPHFLLRNLRDSSATDGLHNQEVGGRGGFGCEGFGWQSSIKSTQCAHHVLMQVRRDVLSHHTLYDNSRSVNTRGVPPRHRAQ